MEKRLTKEDILNISKNPSFILPRLVGKQMSSQIINELLEYKTIEEKFGIDLVTLVKALDDKNTKYFDDGCESNHILLNFKNKSFICPNGDEYYFKDFGITWALDKKELELEYD